MATIVSLDGIRAKRNFEQHASVMHERVFDRVERLTGILTSGGISTKGERDEYWNSAVNALIQYLDNEFPIEKDNKCRANMVAEHAALLYASGIFDEGLSDKALKLQTAVLDALEPENNDPVKNQFAAARANYGKMVQALIDARFNTRPVETQSSEPQEPVQ